MSIIHLIGESPQLRADDIGKLGGAHAVDAEDIGGVIALA